MVDHEKSIAEAQAALTKAKEVARAARRAEMKELRQQQMRDESRFKQDLLQLHGVTDHPKAERCYELAYEYGHSAGLDCVANYFAELVTLIED